MKPCLTVPAALAVSLLSLSASSCSSTTVPSPVADSGAADRVDANPLDIADVTEECPDPLKCYTDFVPLDGGGVGFVYLRRDGGASDVPCPPTPPQCPIA